MRNLGIGLRWVCLFFLVQSCATQPKYLNSTVVQSQNENLFKDCIISEGSHRLELREDKEYIAGVDLDWISRKKGWILEGYNQLGQTIGRLSYDEGAKLFYIRGQLQDRIPELKISESGYMLVDGHEIGIKPREVSCLLDSSLPSAWLNILTGHSFSNGKTQLNFVDEMRSIKVEIAESERSCVFVSWAQFLFFFHSTIQVCFVDEDEGKTITVEGIDEYTLKFSLQGS